MTLPIDMSRAIEVMKHELGWLDEQDWEGLSGGERRSVVANHLAMALDTAGFDLSNDVPASALPQQPVRRAPVQGTLRRDPRGVKPKGTITWTEHLAIYEVYAARFGRQQSAERMAERAGFGYWEATDLLGHEPETWEPLETPR